MEDIPYRWTPTMGLRFIVKDVTPFYTMKVLQQKWVCKATGNEEWRDIPTIN